MESNYSASQIKALVRVAKNNRKNRVYYEDSFDLYNLYRSGIIQSEAKSALDRVTLDKSSNETIHLFGFDPNGTYFDLSLSILSLYPDTEKANEEARWRLGKVKLVYSDSKCEYLYEDEELLDYEDKRKHSNQHECKNIYKIGYLSIENVLPFSLSRILFNGPLIRREGDKSEQVSAKITISTHPASDKFDYQYKFNVDYLSKIISDSLLNDKTKLSARELLSLILEDRIDQPLMFQGHIELLDSFSKESKEAERFIVWGSKVKRFIKKPPTSNEQTTSLEDCQREDLFLWTDCGHQVHLTRPSNLPGLVYGLINSAYDYASYLYSAQLKRENGTGSFSALKSFSKLSAGSEILLKGYKIKNYEIKFLEDVSAVNKPFEVSINKFKGWGIVRNIDHAREFIDTQARLLALGISDGRLTFKLSSERLLGGKGNSLVELSKLVTHSSSFDLERFTDSAHTNVSVPSGIVVSCVAYQIWLNSSPLIAESLKELDSTRRTLAARSVYTNPLSDNHVTLAQSQQILRDQCQKTCTVLKEQPLPELLKGHLHMALERLFSSEQLRDTSEGSTKENATTSIKRKVFAVRSSAVGEDSLETSAAGQMTTFLNIQGFGSICQAIIDCWSSQFNMEAVIYKTQNGLQFNLPMAVVVQELVECQVAGVATTCDAMTGNRQILEILANPGLGEGVVSGGRADTVRVCLKDAERGISIEDVGQRAAKLAPEGKVLHSDDKSSDAHAECCLSDPQIVSLTNLFLWLRRQNGKVDCEIEWGITGDTENNYRIHLLQRRPLTHLNRLSSREIDHELDSGFIGPLDVVSRANLGEVMPGAMCPLTMTYFFPVVINSQRGKPFELNHTRKTFAPDSFAFYGQVISMVLTNSDILSRFPVSVKTDDAKHDETMAVRMMIGTLTETPKDIEGRERLHNERLNPLSSVKPKGLANIMALDLGMLKMYLYASKKRTENWTLTKSLTSLDEFIRRIDKSSPGDNKVFQDINKEIGILFTSLTTQTDCLLEAWRTHIRATILSMSFNVMCLKVLISQKAYPEKMKSSELLNDFSILMRNSGGKTESGDISNLLAELIELLIKEGRLDTAKQMNVRQLYDYLIDGQDKCAQLYREFMNKNGHRTFKEFDMSTLTWADDPSYIIKSLSSRLRAYNATNAEKELKDKLARERDHEVKTREILNNKVESLRTLLSGYLLPRARNAVVRREQSKSLLIKTIDLYRCSFRHLGALLCLAGRLPCADLIFHLSIEELDMIVRMNSGGCERADLARIIFKARRRQQRQRVLNKITFARPVIDFGEMVETVRSVSEATEGDKAATGSSAKQQVADQSESADQKRTLVRGMTSCAGLVTGRACVVNSLDDMDQIEPNDILITYSIDISWSVYFFALAGIVTEIGGIVSHGAVVAREYGIPTLCTAFGACSTFKTGQIVTLNANQGICYLADESSDANHE